MRTLPPTPKGWYTVAFSHELPVGAVRAVTLAERPHVLFRTRSGAVAMLDAFCPHMGASLAHGGRVDGEAIVCPMHAFAFDGDGRCVRTGYDTKPPPRCQSSATPVREQSGLVIAWHDESGVAPDWAPEPVDLTGFSPLRTHIFHDLATHPQETTENSVDLGHLAVVHGYQRVDVIAPLETRGSYLTTAYRLVRRPFIPGTRPVEMAFTIHAYGLGYSFVDVDVESHGLHARAFVLPTPTRAGRIDLHLATCVRGGRGLVRHVPARVLDLALGRLMLASFLADVRQDLPLWENKTSLPMPALARGDGPIGPYRQWARQFYPPPHETTLRASSS